MIRILTDSSSDLTQKYCEDNNIAMIPLAVNFGNKTYYDGIDITKDEFYDLLEKSAELPTTSLASPADFSKQFDKYPNDDIICLMIGSGLSGTVQSAHIAKEDSQRDNITIIETGQTSIGLALIVEYAVELINEGKGYQEIIELLEKDIPRVEIRVVVDTLKYLVKGGRLSKVSGAVGSVLSIKPIIQCLNGVLTNIGKARGVKASIKLLADAVKENYDPNRPVKYFYSATKENLDILQSEMEGVVGETVALGPIVGAHVGPKSAAIAYFNKK